MRPSLAGGIFSDAIIASQSSSSLPSGETCPGNLLLAPIRSGRGRVRGAPAAAAQRAAAAPLHSRARRTMSLMPPLGPACPGASRQRLARKGGGRGNKLCTCRDPDRNGRLKGELHLLPSRARGRAGSAVPLLSVLCTCSAFLLLPLPGAPTTTAETAATPRRGQRGS